MPRLRPKNVCLNVKSIAPLPRLHTYTGIPVQNHELQVGNVVPSASFARILLQVEVTKRDAPKRNASGTKTVWCILSFLECGLCMTLQFCCNLFLSEGSYAHDDFQLRGFWATQRAADSSHWLWEANDQSTQLVGKTDTLGAWSKDLPLLTESVTVTFLIHNARHNQVDA